MLKRFIFLLSLLLTPIVQAHFFAQLTWENPATGQVLEEYCDCHEGSRVPYAIEQRSLLIRAQKIKNLVAIIEDPVTADLWNDLNNRGITNTKDYLYQYVKRRLVSPATENATPLHCLAALFFIHDIATCNVERPHTFDKESMLKVITAHNDNNPILNEYYASLGLLAKKRALISIEADKSELEKLYQGYYALDARILHEIHTNRDRHILLAAGAAHIVNINNILLKLGWVLRNVVVEDSLTDVEKKQLASLLIPTHIEEKQELVDVNFQAKVQKIMPLIHKSRITIDTIPQNPLCSRAPVIDLDKNIEGVIECGHKNTYSFIGKQAMYNKKNYTISRAKLFIEKKIHYNSLEKKHEIYECPGVNLTLISKGNFITEIVTIALMKGFLPEEGRFCLLRELNRRRLCIGRYSNPRGLALAALGLISACIYSMS